MSYSFSMKARSRKWFCQAFFWDSDPWDARLYRVEVTEDTKIPNAATVKVVKQDHTLGNMIRGCDRSYLL